MLRESGSIRCSRSGNGVIIVRVLLLLLLDDIHRDILGSLKVRAVVVSVIVVLNISQSLDFSQGLLVNVFPNKTLLDRFRHRTTQLCFFKILAGFDGFL